MGASNVAAAYAKYAGKVPPLALNCLVYMALVSKDDDMHPSLSALSPWRGTAEPI